MNKCFTPHDTTTESRNGDKPTIAKCAALRLCSVVHSPTPQGVLRLRRFQGGLINQELRSQLLESSQRRWRGSRAAVPDLHIFGRCRANVHYDLRLLFTLPPNIGLALHGNRILQALEEFIDDRLHLVTIPTYSQRAKAGRRSPLSLSRIPSEIEECQQAASYRLLMLVRFPRFSFFHPQFPSVR